MSFSIIRYWKGSLVSLGLLFFIVGCNTPDKIPTTGSQAAVTTQLHEVRSEIRGESVPVSVILPPNFSESDRDLPLLIHLHGGGGDRNTLIGMSDLYTHMFSSENLPSMVVVSFSGGPGSFYYGSWEEFVVKELPAWANQTFGTSLDPKKTLMTGISMGGYATLKIGFKNPDRFKAIAPMEPAIMPILKWPEQNTRASWWLPKASVEAIWGSQSRVGRGERRSGGQRQRHKDCRRPVGATHLADQPGQLGRASHRGRPAGHFAGHLGPPDLQHDPL